MKSRARAFGRDDEGCAALLAEIAACRACAAHLPHGPRPVVQLAPEARLLIIGQAPGARVHASGIAWDDRSGARLRDWTGLDSATFYDPRRVAMVPMGFCYPGKGESADLPPRPECAKLWHARALKQLPDLRLTLLVGFHAQRHYLGGGGALTDNVRAYRRFLPAFLPLPHPSWRSTFWMRSNTWFAAELLPDLRRRVAAALS